MPVAFVLPAWLFFRSFQVVALIMADHDVEQLDRSSSAASATSTTASPQPPPTGAAVADQALVTFQARPAEEAAHGATSSVNAEIDRLLKEQKRIKQERKEMSALLKNAQRRRKRLKHKARLLSKTDLMEVMMLRSEEEASKRARTEDDPVEPAPGGAAEGEARAPGHASASEEENRTP